MTTAFLEYEPLVEELIEVLDQTIALQLELLGQLKPLTQAVLDRDDAATERLLKPLAETPDRLDAAGRRRTDLQARLAAALGCAPGEVTLERLVLELPEDHARAIRHRRERLLRVAESVRAQHLETAVLVAEIARVNRSILCGLFPQDAKAGTYRTDGTAPWRGDQGLLDARR